MGFTTYARSILQKDSYGDFTVNTNHQIEKVDGILRNQLGMVRETDYDKFQRLERILFPEESGISSTASVTIKVQKPITGNPDWFKLDASYSTERSLRDAVIIDYKSSPKNNEFKYSVSIKAPEGIITISSQVSSEISLP